MPPEPNEQSDNRCLAIALAGAGEMGRTHARALERCGACRLAAIADPSPHAEAYARSARVSWYAGLDALLDAEQPDGVVVASPNALHETHAIACLEAGVPVLVEKPLAHSLEAGERIVRAAERTGTPLLVGHHRVHSPLLAQAREIVRSGAIGELVAVQGSALFYKPDDYFDAAPWRREPGGGPILINLIHEIGNLRALAGEIVAVQALASHVQRRHAVEDTVVIGMAFAGGALGTFALSDTAASQRSWEQTARENPIYANAADEDCYLIVGTLGSLAFPTMRLKRFERRADRSWSNPMQRHTVARGHGDPLDAQCAHFAAVVRGEAAPRVDAHDGLANLRVIDAIMRAIERGTTVTLPSPGGTQP